MQIYRFRHCPWRLSKFRANVHLPCPELLVFYKLQTQWYEHIDEHLPNNHDVPCLVIILIDAKVLLPSLWKHKSVRGGNCISVFLAQCASLCEIWCSWRLIQTLTSFMFTVVLVRLVVMDASDIFYTSAEVRCASGGQRPWTPLEQIASLSAFWQT